MAMTQREVNAKRKLIRHLNEQGYPKYARLLDKLDVKLLDRDSDDIAYIIASKATMYLNPGINIDQASTIVRHEILHQYLEHQIRMDKLIQQDKAKYGSIPHSLYNTAADYEISNRGYTDADKAIARSILFKDKVVSGLVTEIDHPDWVNKSFEEMLDLLMADTEAIKQAAMNDLNRTDDPEQQEQTLDKQQSQAQQLSSAAQQKEKEAESESEKQDAQDAQEQAQAIQNAVKQTQDELNKSKGAAQQDFPTEEAQETAEEIQARVKEYQKALKDLKKDIFKETDEAKEKEKVAKAAKDLQKYRSNPLNIFANSLKSFIKNEVDRVTVQTWTRPHKTYTDSGIMHKGIARQFQKNIPSINVYFDLSGSFSNFTEKIDASKRALSSINQYERQGYIKVNLYYVTDTVYSSVEDATKKTWGADGYEILRHVHATKPWNVVVITDSDAWVDSGRVIEIPGAAWFVYFENEANLQDYIIGKKLNKVLFIEDF